jgi:putative flippase GtrA
MRLRDLIDRLLTGRLLTREVRTFLAVGGTGYVVDVAAFNLLRSLQPFSALDPSVARTLAVALAMCVTYLGNRTLTWLNRPSGDRRREIGLFVLFNIVGLGFSVITLIVSHDVLGLTSRTADNISANVLGLALGTIFRYLTYKRFVFAPPASGMPSDSGQAGRRTNDRATDDQHQTAGSSRNGTDFQAGEIRAA